MEKKLLEAGKACRLQIGKLKAAFATCVASPVTLHIWQLLPESLN